MITIKITKGEPLVLPADAVFAEIEGDTATVYFKGDPQVDNIDLLENARRHAKIKVKQETEQQIKNGFTSSATGADKNYQAELTDQINIISAALSNLGAVVSTDDGKTIITPAQIKTLNKNMVEQRELFLAEKQNKYQLIDAATTETELNSIIGSR